MKRIMLEQGSLAWNRWRDDGIGGSDAPIILGVSKYDKTRAQLLIEKANPGSVPPIDNFAMRRGRRLEPIARKRYCDQFGLPMTPMCGEHDHASWMKVSLDGWWGNICLEVKCPDWKQHEFALAGIVPPHFVPQLVHIAFVCGAELVHYWSFNDGKRFAKKDQVALVPFRPLDDQTGELVEAEERFWAEVMEMRTQLAGAA